MPTLAELQNQRNQFFKQKGEQQRGQIAGETQGNVEALQRRFTSMGGAGTGAAISAEQKAREAGLAQQRAAATDLAGQQMQLGESDIARQFQAEQTQQGQGFAAEQARLGREAQFGESALGRQFAAEQARLGIEAQRGESEATRGFTGEQARLAREAQLGESEATRVFTGEQARLAREAQLGESKAGRQFTAEQADLARRAQLGDSEAARQLQERLATQDIGFKKELAATEQGNKLKEMDLAYQQFLIDKDTTAFNKRLSAIQAGIDPNTVGAMDGTTGSFQTIAQTEAEKARVAEQKRAETLRPTNTSGANPNIDTTTKNFITFGRMGNNTLTPNPNYIDPEKQKTREQRMAEADARLSEIMSNR